MVAKVQQAAGVVAVEGSAARLRAAPEPGEAIQAMGVAWTAAEAQARVQLVLVGAGMVVVAGAGVVRVVGAVDSDKWAAAVMVAAAKVVIPVGVAA